ncbi:MAG: class I SAM-dependent methyltransferase [Candidatus Pacebacteria bacterium]|nr:class I SAM-dependent methyltransferase [Candidatus Paceibacterota bacterium]
MDFDESKKLKKVDCPLCDSSRKEVLFRARNVHGDILLSREEFSWVRCLGCGLAYVSPRPDQKTIWQYYPRDYYDPRIKIPRSFLKAYRRRYNRARLSLVLKFASLPGRLLDLGAGEGIFVKVAREAGLEALGVEPGISGKRIKDFKFGNGSFDVVTLWHVLEHMPQPQKEIREIKRVLKRRGWLFLSLPNFKSFGFRLGKTGWFHLDTPRHLAGYSPKTVKKLLEDGGFELLKIGFPAFEDPFDLAKTINFKLFDQNCFLKILFFLPFLGFSLILKAISPLFRASETIWAAARKQ